MENGVFYVLASSLSVSIRRNSHFLQKICNFTTRDAPQKEDAMGEVIRNLETIRGEQDGFKPRFKAGF